MFADLKGFCVKLKEFDDEGKVYVGSQVVYPEVYVEPVVSARIAGIVDYSRRFCSITQHLCLSLQPLEYVETVLCLVLAMFNLHPLSSASNTVSILELSDRIISKQDSHAKSLTCFIRSLSLLLVSSRASGIVCADAAILINLVY